MALKVTGLARSLVLLGASLCPACMPSTSVPVATTSPASPSSSAAGGASAAQAAPPREASASHPASSESKVAAPSVPPPAASSDACDETKGPYDGVVAECRYAPGYSFLVLLLDHPIDVWVGHLDSTGHMPGTPCMHGVKAMHLIANEVPMAALARLVGKHVRFPSGDTTEAISRHHNTRILFEPEEVGDVVSAADFSTRATLPAVRDDLLVNPCSGWKP